MNIVLYCIVVNRTQQSWANVTTIQ